MGEADSSDFSENNLLSLPDRFGSLPALTHLKAMNASLAGPIPQSLLSSSSLTNLNLASNALIGPVTITAPKLVSLALQGNKLDTVMMSGTRLPGLQKVYLGDNAFQSILPDLSGSRGLTVFDAGNNR